MKIKLLVNDGGVFVVVLRSDEGQNVFNNSSKVELETAKKKIDLCAIIHGNSDDYGNENESLTNLSSYLNIYTSKQMREGIRERETTSVKAQFLFLFKRSMTISFFFINCRLNWHEK